MSDIAIRVENLGKKYHIGGKQERYSTLRDSLVQGISAPFKRIGGLLRGEAAAASDLSEEIWALKDVSFDIKHGDVVGIIGRNGAGKSTLLKILSQITEPTTGRVEIYGRVGALLEVGTGFHPELTGRENIFLNGAILGMRRKEMERKFDEIVDFSGVEKFIDTPVKHYSSGMQMRLAFAVAAHLEPEILIVDEVLAVGDAEFQKKCMGKMGEVAKGGRTVLFVSHNLAAVGELCTSAVLLSAGKLAIQGLTHEIVRHYLQSGNNTQALAREFSPLSSLSKAYFKWVEIVDNSHRVMNTIGVNDQFKVVTHFCVIQPIRGIAVGIQVFNELGQLLFISEKTNDELSFLAGNYKSSVVIPNHFLVPDSVYSLTIALHIPNVEILDYRQHVVNFYVEETGSLLQRYKGVSLGQVLVDFNWDVSYIGN